MSGLDPRLNAFRPDRADARLKGRVEAERFVEGIARRVIVPSAPLKCLPRADAGLDTEVLRGEIFRVFEEGRDGWSWGQLETDSYVGYVPTGALGSLLPEPTHRITALGTFIYSGPDMKLPAEGMLSLESRVAFVGKAETRGTVYNNLVGGGWIVAAHSRRLDASPQPDFPPDFLSVAQRFVETPYLWGGRTSAGVDCSGLVQLALMAAGQSAPRDTDMQEKMLGTAIAGGITGSIATGDLVFWRGHVGIVLERRRLLHASGHHMTVVIEPLGDAISRITKSYGAPSSVRRLP